MAAGVHAQSWIEVKCEAHGDEGNVRFGSFATMQCAGLVVACQLRLGCGNEVNDLGQWWACWSFFQTEENGHARSYRNLSKNPASLALEQGQDDRGQAAPTLKACLVNPDKAPGRRTDLRSGYVQSRNRQQIARLRCRRPQG
jgi:hypothetical protein